MTRTSAGEGLDLLVFICGVGDRQEAERVLPQALLILATEGQTGDGPSPSSGHVDTNKACTGDGLSLDSGHADIGRMKGKWRMGQV